MQSHENFRASLRRRVDFGAEVIEREVLAKKGKALLIFGSGHFIRNQQIKTPTDWCPSLRHWPHSSTPGFPTVSTWSRKSEAPPSMFPSFQEGLRLSGVADAVIDNGPHGNPLIQPSPIYATDEAYAIELQRRVKIASPPRPKPQ